MTESLLKVIIYRKMKRQYFLLASLAMVSASVFGQKLSTNTEFLLLNRNANPAFKSVAFGDGQSVDAFVKVSSSSVLSQIEALGGKVNSTLSDGLCTMTLPIDKIREIAALDEVSFIEAADKVNLLMSRARADVGVDKCHQLEATTGNYTGSGVVIGIVDNGMELGHRAFYDSTGKTYRIKRFWNQNSSIGTRPSGFTYGVESKTESSILAKQYDLTSTFHATHVGGIAAGADMESGYYGVAPDADIVFVSTNMTSTGITDGVNYVFKYAESVGKPCVVNLSLGSHAGPHDGSSSEDLTYESLTGPGRIIVGASGNEGMETLHAGKTLAAEGDDSLAVMVDRSYYSNQYYGERVQVWGEAGKPMTIKAVLVNSLTGKVLAASDEFSSSSAVSKYASIVYNGVSYTAQISTSVYKYNNRPTAQLMFSGQATGNFRLGFIAKSEPGATIHAWGVASTVLYTPSTSVKRKGWTAGDTDYTSGETGGTGKAVISVGSYNTYLKYDFLNGTSMTIPNSSVGYLNDISTFSSHGPTADGRQKPDVAAPGCAIVSSVSKYASNDIYGTSTTFSEDYVTAKTTFKNDDYYYGAEMGTSMACPVVTGTVALWLQANPQLTPEKVREVINATARRDDKTGEKPAGNDNVWGAGKLDAYAGLQYVIDDMNNTSGITDRQMAGADFFRVVTDRNARTAQVFFAEGAQPVRVLVYTAAGRQVSNATLAASGQTIDLGSLAGGVYIFKLQRGGQTQTVKTAI